MSGCGHSDAGDKNSVGNKILKNKSRTNLYGVKNLIEYEKMATIFKKWLEDKI
jgi:hypothetical protein